MAKGFLDGKNKEEKFETPTQHLIVGRYHLIKNELDEAIKEYAKALQMDPNYLDAHFNLAEACFAKATEQSQLSPREKKKILILASIHYHKIATLSPESQLAVKAMIRLKDLQEKLK